MMRLIALAGVLSLGAGTAALGQAPAPHGHTGDVALTYQWVRSNTQPGECGCFDLNGGGVSASISVTPSLVGVAEVSGGHAGHGPITNNSLTLVSYMAGARYLLGERLGRGEHALEPFAQVLVGGAHAGGGIAGAGDASLTFAARVGGGLDMPINARWAVRLLQVDYYVTTAANTVNDHQNNLLVGAGVAFRWAR